jgi:hypothetical protein
MVVVVLQHHLLQNGADSLALENAVSLNMNDRAGQINNLVARSRELVFNSRQAFDASSGAHEYLRPLSGRLLQLSRAGATRVADEKKRLVQSTLSELLDRDAGVQSQLADFSPLQDKQARLTDLEVGFLIDQSSDVPASPGSTLLYTQDLQAGYIQKATNSYNAFVNLKLPGPDSDLNFTLSAMPSLNSTRLTDGANFKPLALLVQEDSKVAYICAEFPSSVRLRLSKPVTIGGDYRTGISTTSAASTNSTLPDP